MLEQLAHIKQNNQITNISKEVCFNCYKDILSFYSILLKRMSKGESVYNNCHKCGKYEKTIIED
jgi:hypothetical protein